MRGKSLRIRQLFLALIVVSVTLVLSFTGFTILFEHHIERRFSDELQNYADIIANGLSVGEDKKLHLDNAHLSPQFNEPLSGLYWRVKNIETGQVLRSRSLWDRDLPPFPEQGKQKDFYVFFQQITLSPENGREKVLIETALDIARLDHARDEFAYELGFYIIFLGLVLLGLIWVQIEAGLRPLRNMKQKVEELLNNPAEQLKQGIYREVEPLTEALNHLLDARAQSLAKAEQRAADLAHGLKSPLAVLRNQAQRLEMQGDIKTAQSLRDISAGLERQIERELTRTRAEMAALRKNAKCDIGKLTEQLVRVLSNTAYGERISWEINIPQGSTFPFEIVDLSEILGPVLDNAARYAKSKVVISLGGRNMLYIDDDGCGMSPQQREGALQRGVRFDERPASSGLGLSIACEILTSYGWSLDLDESPFKGLRVKIYDGNT